MRQTYKIHMVGRSDTISHMQMMVQNIGPRPWIFFSRIVGLLDSRIVTLGLSLQMIQYINMIFANVELTFLAILIFI